MGMEAVFSGKAVVNETAAGWQLESQVGKAGRGLSGNRSVDFSFPSFILVGGDEWEMEVPYCTEVKWSVAVVSSVYVLDRGRGIRRSERNVTRKNEGMSLGEVKHGSKRLTTTLLGWDASLVFDVACENGLTNECGPL